MKNTKLTTLIITTLTLLTLTACGPSKQELTDGFTGGYVAENMNKAGNGEANEVPTIMERVEDATPTIVEKTTDVADETATKTKEFIDAPKTKETAEKVGSKLSEWGNTAKEKMSEGFDNWVNAPATDNKPTAPSVNTDELSKLKYNSGDHAIIPVNDNVSTLDKDTWNGNGITYSNLDNLNRVGTATAYLNKDNVGPSEGRGSQTWEPTAWHKQKKNGKSILNRGHLIAYTTSFKLDDNGNVDNDKLGSENNPLNLHTQTQYSNVSLFPIYEDMVRDALNDNKEVIYQVTPVFNGDELMARGANLQAVSTDGTLNFNVYIFNVQPGVEFNYSDGTSTINHDFIVNK